MKRCCLPFWVAAVVLLTQFTPVLATSVTPPDFDGMVDKSDYIVRALVKSVTSDWRDVPGQPGQRYIGTFVGLDVLEPIKGSPPSPLVLDLVGGTVGDQQLTIVGAPDFKVGQECILFVKGNGQQIVPLVRMMHGFYPVQRDKRTGKSQVMRSNGKHLYSEQDVSLTEDAVSPHLVLEPSARPLDATEFARRIRESKNFSHREIVE